eukprot:366431-Chlamydomonas_euryale.AAC.27
MRLFLEVGAACSRPGILLSHMPAHGRRHVHMSVHGCKVCTRLLFATSPHACSHLNLHRTPSIVLPPCLAPSLVLPALRTDHEQYAAASMAQHCGRHPQGARQPQRCRSQTGAAPRHAREPP